MLSSNRDSENAIADADCQHPRDPEKTQQVKNLFCMPQIHNAHTDMEPVTVLGHSPLR